MMDVDTFLRDPVSRRGFFRAAGVSVLGGSAVFLAACGDDEPGTTTSIDTKGIDTAKNADMEILNAALDLELTAVAAYAAGVKLLRGEALTTGRLFLEQEQEHVQALETAIADLGGTANTGKPSYNFPSFSNQEDVLRFALDLENTAVAAYLDALPKLTDPTLRGTTAAIVTNEAEHIAVLLGALDMQQVPGAFVVGEA